MKLNFHIIFAKPKSHLFVELDQNRWLNGEWEGEKEIISLLCPNLNLRLPFNLAYILESTWGLLKHHCLGPTSKGCRQESQAVYKSSGGSSVQPDWWLCFLGHYCRTLKWSFPRAVLLFWPDSAWDALGSCSNADPDSVVSSGACGWAFLSVAWCCCCYSQYQCPRVLNRRGKRMFQVWSTNLLICNERKEQKREWQFCV